jgi:hypothetical protein
VSEFNLEKEVQKATEDWKMKHSAACPGGVKDGIYTQEFKYHWGSEWYAFENTNSGFLSGPKGRGKTEEEAIQDLKDQL